jgi:conjugative transfer signal peptidase TraF
MLFSRTIRFALKIRNLHWTATPNRRRLNTVLILLAIPTAALACLYKAGYRQNLTESQPPGIYRLTDNPNDPLVSFCPTGTASSITTTRGYRAQAWGCPDGHAPMLKPVAAKTGDTVLLSKAGIYVNGILLPNTRRYQQDNLHRPLFPLPDGKYVVKPGTLWVLSSYNQLSYDSRYFGPISIAQVVRHAHLVYRYHLDEAHKP